MTAGDRCDLRVGVAGAGWLSLSAEPGSERGARDRLRELGWIGLVGLRLRPGAGAESFAGAVRQLPVGLAFRTGEGGEQLVGVGLEFFVGVAHQPPHLGFGEALPQRDAETSGFTLGCGSTLIGGAARLGESLLLGLARFFDLREAAGGFGVVLRRLLVLSGECLPLGSLSLPVLIGLIVGGVVSGWSWFVVCHREIVAGRRGRLQGELSVPDGDRRSAAVSTYTIRQGLTPPEPEQRRPMTPARAARDFITDLIVQPDGINRVRKAEPHSRDKLGILRYYLPGFTRACQKWPGGPYFVDACAGPGLYSFSDSVDLLRGSSLIALGTGRDLPAVRAQSDLSVQKVIALEKGKRNFGALQSRLARYDKAAVAKWGDCNVDLLPLMAREIPRKWPLLAFLDPEAFEVEWQTVEKVAAFRGDQLTEMLVLVNPNAVLRVLGAGLIDQPKMLRAFPPNSELESIIRERAAGHIDGREAKRQVVDAYVAGLRGLGYHDPFYREITKPGKAPLVEGGEVYTLVFCSQSPSGTKIMESAFDRIYTNQPDPPAASPQLPMDLGLAGLPLTRLPGARRSRR